jgi:hypothetical protein
VDISADERDNVVESEIAGEGDTVVEIEVEGGIVVECCISGEGETAVEIVVEVKLLLRVRRCRLWKCVDVENSYRKLG